MSTSRKSKIARLPLEIREDLNRRLQNSESGVTLLDWLHALPAVQAVLAADFDGRAINLQNLSEWRRGGYQDWLAEQKAEALARQLGLDLRAEQPAEHHGLTETLALWLAGRYAVAAGRVRKARSAEEHWRLLHEMCVDVARLRQGDHRARRLAMALAQAERREERRAALAETRCNGGSSVDQASSSQIKA
ncbi:MAG: hypothetical protein P4L99_27035 [Chthoniobacter sp.]|nr:hypothetical protein [Chthoniobacter sp.]